MLGTRWSVWEAGRRLKADAVGMRRDRRAADLMVDGCCLLYVRNR